MKIENGMIFKAPKDSETPDMEIEVIETGITVEGLNGCKIRFTDGSIEEVANAVLQQAVEMYGVEVIK